MYVWHACQCVKRGRVCLSKHGWACTTRTGGAFVRDLDVAHISICPVVLNWSVNEGQANSCR